MSITCLRLVFASLSGVQTLIKWQKERGEKLQFLADMDIAIQNYGQVKVTFLESRNQIGPGVHEVWEEY